MSTPSLIIDSARTAVLSLDLQTALVSIYTNGDAALVSRAAALLKEARQHQIRVIHVQVGFRPGLPEVSFRNQLLGAIKMSVQHQQIFQGTAGAIHSALEPQQEDIFITKHRISAFAGTDLDMILRAQDIDTLILFGIATSGAVLSTLLHASDADYRLIVLKDCCADLDPEVHACLVGTLFPRLATVLDAEQCIDALKASASK